MRILNRVIVAGALVVPMALGAAGVAAAGSSVLPTQIRAAEEGSEDCLRGDDCGYKDDDGNFLSFLTGEDDDECEDGDDKCGDDDDNGGLLG